MRRILWSFLGLLYMTCWAKCEVVTLKNGDRLTGHWKNVKGNELRFRSDVLGEVTIPVDKVASFAAPEPVVVITKGGETVHGLLSVLPTGGWRVKAPGAVKTLPPQSVTAVVSEKAFRSNVSERPGLPWKGWKTQTNFGFSIQQGDQQTRTLGVGVNAVRKQPDLPGLVSRWRTNFTLNILLATTESEGVRIGANTASGSLRQDYLFAPHEFVFALAQLDKIQPQDLNLRQTYGGGMGHDLINKKRFDLSLLAGTTFVDAKFFATPRIRSVELLTGEKFGGDIRKGLRLDHYVNFFTNLPEPGRYRFDSNTSLSLDLTSRLALNASVADYYTSTAPPSRLVTTIGPNGSVVTRKVGPQKNNITLTTGFSFSF